MLNNTLYRTITRQQYCKIKKLRFETSVWQDYDLDYCLSEKDAYDLINFLEKVKQAQSFPIKDYTFANQRNNEKIK